MMIEVEGVICSEDIFKEEFVCNIHACKGACCVEGDSGAPLTNDEVEILEKIYPEVKNFLTEDGRQAIEKQGTSVVDFDGERVTPLVNGKECAYTVFDENNIAKCGIELAFNAGKTSFQKPISCHLYPIREKKLGDTIALNYDRWTICNPACSLGKELSVKVFKFLKNPLMRRFGKEWYENLETTYTKACEESIL